MNTPLISAANLRATTPAPLLLDCSFDLADPTLGEQAYAAGHLPGALYVHLDRDLSGPKTGLNGRHPLRTREAYAGWMASIGITPDRDVVVYDRQAGMFAVRAWWVLRWLGHPRVALLDGGLDAWVRGGGELSTQVPVPSPVAATPVPAPAMPTIDAATLLGRLPRVRVLDARAPERYRGDVEPIDRVAGHIPGARNRFFKDNLQADGTFKPAEVLRAEYEALTAGATDVVLQCGSGVTACHDLIAMEVAGLGTATLYPGSWSEWSADPARPVERGTAA
jgi:thiosulfate/3-mercaptopyruvate sulfurtransferase